MAYDRYDTRDERSRWSSDRISATATSRSGSRRGGRGRADDRGFFERAGDEVASWFGDEDPNAPNEPPAAATTAAMAGITTATAARAPAAPATGTTTAFAAVE